MIVICQQSHIKSSRYQVNDFYVTSHTKGLVIKPMIVIISTVTQKVYLMVSILKLSNPKDKLLPKNACQNSVTFARVLYIKQSENLQSPFRTKFRESKDTI